MGLHEPGRIDATRISGAIDAPMVPATTPFFWDTRYAAKELKDCMPERRNLCFLARTIASAC